MDRFREDRLGDVIDRFYEAAARPELWGSVLAEYSTAIGAEGAILLPGPKANLAPVCSNNVLEIVESGVKECWFDANPRVTRGVPALTNTRAVLTESHIFTPRELDRLPFNAEFIAAHGFRWFAGIYLVPAGMESVMLSAERRAGQEMFSHREIALIERAIPHLQRAGQLAIRFAEARGRGVLDGLSAMRCGAALLDAGGKVIRFNARLQDHLGPALSLSGGMLRAGPSQADAALGKLIGSVLRRGPIQGAEPRGAVAVPRPNGPPLIVHAAPLVASAQDVFERARAIVLVVDPSDGQEPTQALLRQAYGLTAAEARLAHGIAQGLDLAEIAQRQGVAVGTLRSQLKSVFAKTDTHRQSQLVKALTRIGLP